jgi:hypothetical protein
VTYSDVLKSLFDLDSGYGAVRLTASTFGLLAQTQTSTPGGGGSFGQSVPLPFLSEDFVKAGYPRYIIGVRDDAIFRTNLIVTNSKEIPTEVEVTLVANNGDIVGSQRVTLPPLGMTQLSRVARTLGGGADIIDARLMLSTPTEGARVAAYASVIDNTTNDPRTLLPMSGPREPREGF